MRWAGVRWRRQDVGLADAHSRLLHCGCLPGLPGSRLGRSEGACTGPADSTGCSGSAHIAAQARDGNSPPLEGSNNHKSMSKSMSFLGLPHVHRRRPAHVLQPGSQLGVYLLCSGEPLLLPSGVFGWRVPHAARRQHCSHLHAVRAGLACSSSAQLAAACGPVCAAFLMEAAAGEGRPERPPPLAVNVPEPWTHSIQAKLDVRQPCQNLPPPAAAARPTARRWRTHAPRCVLQQWQLQWRRPAWPQHTSRPRERGWASTRAPTASCTAMD